MNKGMLNLDINEQGYASTFSLCHTPFKVILLHADINVHTIFEASV